MFSVSEILLVFQWWAVFFAIGVIFTPITNSIFRNFVDRGYLFSKVLGLGIISYCLLVLNVLHILPFGLMSIILILWICVIINFIVFKRKIDIPKSAFKLIIFEEIIFLLGIITWSFIRAHEPSINGLEKFMDFGFLNSILRTTWQPATDMWFPPFPINYYYFGHLTTAVATELSRLPSLMTYNLMIATLFSFSFSLSFSLGVNIISKTFNRKSFMGGILMGILLSLAGNLHTIYAFFKPYNVDHPVPFWNLQFLPNTFPNAYWYPNATRFIPFTIHEFPLYSFVVSDLHGHVVDIMYVLLLIALAYVVFLQKSINKFLFVLISLFLAIMYMTNVWDGLIYMLLVFGLITFKNWQPNKLKITFIETSKSALAILFLFFIFSLPFTLFFKPFAEGIGILCAPTFLTNLGRLGPFLFEANHCQRSEWWQLLTLYGFFYFFVISFLLFLKWGKQKLQQMDFFVLILITLASLLILIPEFVYVKDIYPAHYRANTMFKLVYQAFIMLSIASGYIIIRIISNSRKNILKIFNIYFVFFIFTVLFLMLVGIIYPYFAIKSYYGDLKIYSGINGLTYLKTRYPQDYDAINWINTNIKGKPIMVEAQGDSYTDYERISANTGLPTVLGWTVHEWLWRGTYDIPAPRIAEIKNIYESQDLKITKTILKKYNAEYIYIGGLEHEKYPNLMESKFDRLGKVIWQESGTKIYKLNI